MNKSDKQDGHPSEADNNPSDLHRERAEFKVRDDVQAWYETGATNAFFGGLTAVCALALWYHGVPFEAIVILLLAKISAETGALWRTYVR